MNIKTNHPRRYVLRHEHELRGGNIYNIKSKKRSKWPWTPRECSYTYLVAAHQETKHGGRDKTHRQLELNYTHDIPKELVANFVRACPTCSRIRPNASANSRKGEEKRKQKRIAKKAASPNSIVRAAIVEEDYMEVDTGPVEDRVSEPGVNGTPAMGYGYGRQAVNTGPVEHTLAMQQHVPMAAEQMKTSGAETANKDAIDEAWFDWLMMFVDDEARRLNEKDQDMSSLPSHGTYDWAGMDLFVS